MGPVITPPGPGGPVSPRDARTMPTAPSVLSPVADPTVASSRSSPSTDFNALIERMLELGQITFKKLQKIQTHIESGKYTKEYYVRKWGSKLAKLTKLQAPDAVPPPTTTSKAGEKTKVALVAELAAKRAGTPRARKLDELNELNLTGKSHGTRGDEDQERKEKKKKHKKKKKKKKHKRDSHDDDQDYASGDNGQGERKHGDQSAEYREDSGDSYDAVDGRVPAATSPVGWVEEEEFDEARADAATTGGGYDYYDGGGDIAEPAEGEPEQLYGCDYNCGFQGSFDVVAAHEEQCPLAPGHNNNNNNNNLSLIHI